MSERGERTLVTGDYVVTLVWAIDEDIAIVAGTGVIVASNPGSRRPPGELAGDQRQVGVRAPLGEGPVIQAGVVTAGERQGEQVDGG